jgi:Phosphotransferase enzyme family
MWVGPDWVEEGTRWARDELARRGIDLVGAGEQIRLEPWSAVLRLPTTDGSMFFKAVTPVHTFEPALTALLSRVRPGSVSEVVAIDEERRWMLTRDAGTRLRELVTTADDARLWEEALPRYAELQIAVADDGTDLLALGVPDQRLSVLPELLEPVLEDADALLIGKQEGLTTAQADELRRRSGSFAAECADLAAYEIPETIQHDDLHDGNVFVKDGRYVFFDWGDSCVSQPFTTMTVTLRALAWRLELEPGGPWAARLRDAYLEPWRGFGSRHELEAAFALAYAVGTVARALAHHRMLAPREPDTRGEDAESVPYGLRLWLERGPVGSWR